MSNQRLLSATIKPEVQAINPDGPRKKIHQSIQIKKYINQSVKEVSSKQPSGEEPLLKKQPSGEGRWVKPVDSPYVEAEWTPICKAKTTTWVPIDNPPSFFSYFTDEEK